MMIVLLFISLALIGYILCKSKSDKLSDPVLVKKIGTLYEDLKQSHKLALVYNGIFIIRRIIYGATIVYSE